jgi:hypothetical protein
MTPKYFPDSHNRHNIEGKKDEWKESLECLGQIYAVHTVLYGKFIEQIEVCSVGCLSSIKQFMLAILWAFMISSNIYSFFLHIYTRIDWKNSVAYVCLSLLYWCNRNNSLLYFRSCQYLWLSKSFLFMISTILRYFKSYVNHYVIQNLVSDD